jgi:regulator of PEP synthase PpsR (kinase-PPPase family)
VADTRYIDVLSDSTGETAERVVRAALLQFPRAPADVRLHPRLRSKEAVRPRLEQAAKDGALVVFTFVGPELREYVHQMTAELRLEAIDVIGSMIGKLGTYLDREPINVPSAMLPLPDEYFRRIEAVEFAVKNDDGAEPRNLPKADLVLVGISRTSKTPLSTYLAQRGLKCANVPLVLGVDPPEELSQVDERKVFGVIVQPDMLMRIRQARLSHLGMPNDSSYGQRAHIENEIAYAREIFRKHPNWPVIDVTNRAIEETAADILRIYQERGVQPS